MKLTKKKSKKYPLKITLSDGTKITVPKQANFSNEWLRNHGCSLMAEYIALQWIGIHKWPINLLKWHKKHTPEDVKSKVTVKGVDKGIDVLGKGKGTSTYYATPTAARISAAMKAGKLVIMEQGGPIHSIVLLPDNGKTYMISYGKVTQVDVAEIARTATTNKTYRGMDVVKRK